MMLPDPAATAIASHVLCHEGLHLDRRDWQAWLALYAERALYWVPAWRNESEETSDPDTEISLIHHDSRAGLEERVARILTRQSVTTMPLPRTTHYVSNIIAVPDGVDRIAARASWMVNAYDPRTTRQFANFGSCEVDLARHGERWLIARKKIHLQNDCISAVLDFYLL